MSYMKQQLIEETWIGTAFLGDCVMTDREREQQEVEEHLYFMTQKALKHAAQYLSQEELDVLMYHSGMTDNDLFPNVKE